MDNALYTATLQTLLKGEVICRERYESLFKYLDNVEHQSQISQYLSVLERDVRATNDMHAYVCCYTQFDEPGVKASCKEQFRLVASTLQPLVEWLNLLMACNPTGTPLRPGDIISKADLLGRLEHSQSHCDTLAKIARSKLFGSNSTELQGQLNQVLKKLTELGYLIGFGHSGSRYRATGKWSVLYDQMGFIRAHEALDDAESHNQERLL